MEPLSVVIGICVTYICWDISKTIDMDMRRRRDNNIIICELKKIQTQINRLDINKQTQE